jgi:hypothetical protein
MTIPDKPITKGKQIRLMIVVSLQKESGEVG